MLQPVTAGDHVCLHGLFTQRGVRRFIFDDEVIPPERTAEIIQKSVDLFGERGFGLWLARLQQSIVGQAGAIVIGFGAFWFFRDPPELELLYGVGDDHLEMGYGREIARAVVRYGVEIVKMPSIRASTDAAHVASRRLLEEIGFVYERQQLVQGLDTVFYEMGPSRL